MDRLRQTELRVPAVQFWRSEALRPVREGAPRPALRWTNYWHPSDPLAYPCAQWLGDGGAVDIAVRLNEKGGEVDPLDYIGQVASREIISPIAYALTQLWLHTNQHIDADTTQLEELAMHGSGTRAALMKRKNLAAERSRVGARKAAAMAKQRAAVMLDKAQAARGLQGGRARDGARCRTPSSTVSSAAVSSSVDSLPGALRSAASGAGLGGEGLGGCLRAAHDYEAALPCHSSEPRLPPAGTWASDLDDAFDPFPSSSSDGGWMDISATPGRGHHDDGLSGNGTPRGGGGGSGVGVGSRALQALRRVEAKVESKARDAAKSVAASERLGAAKGMLKGRFRRQGSRPASASD